MSPLDDVLSRLSASSKLGRQELDERVRKKQDELHGLVSAEGAAHLVAKELGVNLLSNGRPSSSRRRRSSSETSCRSLEAWRTRTAGAT
ncbi:MAG: DUF2240 family protein [Candidatus Aenigmarchaeota archaeon]|nr:DUF2240 family protein [Candidatus Aenigmarchaeota archaeon]